MRQVHFVDTSILCCLLRLPDFCDIYMEIKEEFLSIISRGDTLILPVASIIETGSHIAHLGNGSTRRTIARRFAEYLWDTADNRAPWSLMHMEWTSDDLRKFADIFPDQAMRRICFGDMSIIDAYEHYVKRTPGVSVRIWSTDAHLMGYSYQAPVIGRRNRD